LFICLIIGAIYFGIKNMTDYWRKINGRLNNHRIDFFRYWDCLGRWHRHEVAGLGVQTQIST
jgi:hypothetical protein